MVKKILVVFTVGAVCIVAVMFGMRFFFPFCESPPDQQVQPRDTSDNRSDPLPKLPEQDAELTPSSAATTPRELGKQTDPNDTLKAGDPISQEMIDAAVKKIVEADVGLRKLPPKLKILVMSDEFGVRVVMKLVDEEQSRPYALEALGWVRRPEVVPEVLDLLKKQWENTDPAVVCNSLISYARVKGEESVPEMTRYIGANYRRSDGFGEQVCGAAAMGLAEIGTRASLEVLNGQLDRMDEPIWLMDYGSRVIAAIVRHDQVSSGSSGNQRSVASSGTFRKVMNKASGASSPPLHKDGSSDDAQQKPGLWGPHQEIARAALIRYAEGLRRRLLRAWGSHEKKYIEGKITEALRVAGVDPSTVSGAPSFAPAEAPPPETSYTPVR